MTVSLKTLLDRSERNMGSGINVVVKDKALELIKRAYDEGIYVQISDGFRSHKEQNALYAKGRSTGGNIVTNARGGQSYHNFGLAVDYFLVSNDGKKAIWDVNKDWRRVAEIGKSLGFEWGGDWSSFKDYPHLQMTGGLSLAQLRAGKKPNLGGKSSAPSKGKVGANLSVDGYWGSKTTRALQDALGTVEDGYISDQVHNQATDAITSGIKFGDGNDGSIVVHALQRKIGSKADGLLGPNTIGALQKYLGTVYDKKLSRPSLVVKELQRRLNKGNL
ncbi:M15 family metallopeptidase [Paraliobacillus ryukyuensis]|uniref:M15 family metallopeptidase n=1 Tax=Paraliobacillus ryukyuensis TaxID=200904 RepID=UPI0009A56D94|nr:M15 family metallopeptidase [Paraliobacillus ryukyuensis]